MCLAATKQRSTKAVRRGVTPLLRRLLPQGIVGDRSGRWLPYRPFRVNGAAYGGLVGTAVDAATFVRAHLRITAGEPRLLHPDPVRRMQTITTPGKSYAHGLGWFRQRLNQQEQPSFVEHLGGGLGVYNTMRIYPEDDLGIVVMSNTPGYDFNALVASIATSMI